MNNLQRSRSIGIFSEVNKQDLREFREKLGLTQEKLAKELKVATNTVARWERGEREIPPYLELALKTIERERVPGEGLKE